MYSISYISETLREMKFKPKGRPNRELEDSEVNKELKKLTSIANIIRNRRPRKDSYLGDGREHGMIMFAFYRRLLVGDFDKKKLLRSADAPMEELKKAGISSSTTLA